MPQQLTDELRRQHFREIAQRAGDSHRRRADAVHRIVAETRKAQGLPPTVRDVEVLERVAAMIEGGDDG